MTEDSLKIGSMDGSMDESLFIWWMDAGMYAWMERWTDVCIFLACIYGHVCNAERVYFRMHVESYLEKICLELLCCIGLSSDTLCSPAPVT